MCTFKALGLTGLAVLSGCQYIPHNSFFTPPENEQNPAWIRIVNYTQHSGIYQYENGVRSGGLIRRNVFVIVHTQEKGMPKAGQDLTFNYYETPIRPNIETKIAMSYVGDRTDFCAIGATFKPKAGHYYQFSMYSSSGKCTMHSDLIERGSDGSGWHLSPNKEVAYSDGSNVSKTIFYDSRYEDPDYKRFSPGK